VAQDGDTDPVAVLRFEDLLRRQGQSPQEAGPQAVAAQALDTLVNMELLYQETRRRGIDVAAERITEQVQELRQGFPSDEAFAQGLEQMGYASGELEAELERQLAIQLLIDSEIAPGVSVSGEELRDYYDAHPEAFRSPERVRARHILIRVAEGAGQEAETQARERIEEIRRRILDGADFAELARELSEDGSSAEGGDLGYFVRSGMVPAFSDAAFSLPLGSLSEPVRSEFGYHLIEVTDRVEAGVVAFQDVEVKLGEYLRYEETMRALERLVAELRETATIVEDLEGLGAGTPGGENDHGRERARD